MNKVISLTVLATAAMPALANFGQVPVPASLPLFALGVVVALLLSKKK